MNNIQLLICILLLAVGVWLTRFLPFIIFKKTQKLPRVIEYLGRVLPAAMMGFLVVYCIKDYNFLSLKEMLPLLAASATVVLLHLYKRNTVLSISVGTVLYMILIRLI